MIDEIERPQMMTIRFAFMIAWITRARWLTESTGGTRKVGNAGSDAEGSKGKKTVICETEKRKEKEKI